MEKVDVLIVGAGASGALATYHLAKAGLKVCCLEQGNWVSQDDYPGNDPVTTEVAAQKKWNSLPRVRQAEADYPINESESDLGILNFNGVGGSTIMWASQWHRLHPSDFRVRSMDGVAEDWPIRYEDLVPYYEEVEREWGISGLGGNPAYPPGYVPPLPPIDIGKLGVKMAKGFNKLGWHWWPGYNAQPSRDYRNLKKCCLRGDCMNGCAEGSKCTTDVIYMKDAVSIGANLITGARVSQITVDKSGKAKGAIYIDRRGEEHEVFASIVIMAANGIGTPRILLNSKSSLFPDGLANSTGLVGKNLMLHPFSTVIGCYDEPLNSWNGPLEILHSMEFYETDEKRGFVRGSKWAICPGGGAMGVFGDVSGNPIGNTWGNNFHINMKSTLGRSSAFGIVSEDLPEETNKVVLDPELTDSDGVPAPKVIYKIGENTMRNVNFMVKKGVEVCEAAGAVATIPVPVIRDSGWHMMGTTKMGTDPKTSVVNEWCRSHDVPNLYVIDGSVFVTSGGVNPTGTICAIARRTVDYIIREGKK